MPRTANSARPGRRRIAVLLFEQVKMLDFIGPAEVFMEANQQVDDYEVVLLSPDGAAVTTSMGVRIEVAGRADSPGEYDTLIVPGSEFAPAVYDSLDLLGAVRALAARSRRVVSVCSGAFALAAAGLLDGRSVTTHWKFAAALAERYPSVRVQPDAIFVRDGGTYTSAGVAAGMDRALARVEEDHGADVARTVAQLLLVYMRRSGGQSQFSASLRATTARTPIARAVSEYVNGDPTRPASVQDLADHVNVSTRHLSRVIGSELGMTPAAYVVSMRLDIATRCLESGCTVAEAAAAAGFASPMALRRAFTARFGVPPSEYQRRFRTTAEEPAAS